MQHQMPIGPSLTARRHKAQLGCELAAEDRFIRPYLDNVSPFAQATHAYAAGATSCPGCQAAQIRAWDFASLWGLSTEPTSEAALLCRSVARDLLADACSGGPGDCFASATLPAAVRSLPRDGGLALQ